VVVLFHCSPGTTCAALFEMRHARGLHGSACGTGHAALPVSPDPSCPDRRPPTLQSRVDLGVQALPFEMTSAQSRVVREILDDMAAPLPMMRLLQGDVGSGKSAVAFLASLAAIGAGFQVALLVPNEVLARQHIRLIEEVSNNMPLEARPRTTFVVGKMAAKCDALLAPSCCELSLRGCRR
jgi:hypothetical protein